MSEEDKSGGLDLGLFKLTQLEPTLEATPDPSLKEEVKSAPKIEESGPLSELSKLAKNSEWSAIAARCEKLMNDDPAKSIDYRLWWVRSNIAGSLMPLSMVAAPIENLFGDLLELEKKGELTLNSKVLASQVLNDAAIGFEKAELGELSLSAYQSAFHFDKGCAPQLLAAAKKVIRELKDTAGLSTKKIEERTARVAKLEEIVKEVGIVAGLGVEKVVQVAQAQPTAQSSSRSWTFLRSDLKYKKEARVALLALLILGSVYLLRGTIVLSGSDGVAHIALNMPNQKHDLRLPASSSTSNVSAIDGLFYDLEDSTIAPAKKSGGVKAAPSSPAAALAPRQKEVLDTAGPKESEEIRRAFSEPERNADDRTAEILFGAHGSAPRNPNLGGSSASDIEYFSTVRMYRIVTPTKIIGRPGFKTEILGELLPGDRVLVEARVESWLQIKSHKGGSGYILYQDAEPIR